MRPHVAFDIYAFPRSDATLEWVCENLLKIHFAFSEMHSRANREDVRRFHPHGIDVGLKDPRDIDPRHPPLHLHVSGHGSEDHSEKTLADLRSVLSELGANMDHIDVGRTRD